MFVTVVLLAIGLVIILSLRDWVRSPYLSKYSIQHTLKTVSHAVALEDWKAAKQHLKPLLEKGIGGKEALLLHARVLRGTKKYERALHVLIDASHWYPEELLFRKEEGKLLIEMGQPLDALEAFKVCAPILRSESDLLSVSQAYLQAGFEDLAWETLSPLLPNSKNGKAFALAGDCLFKCKKYQGSIDFYQKALKTGWNTYQILTQLGHAYRRLGDLAEAERLFRKILETDSNDVPATLGLGACMQERGLYQKALLIYQSGRAWEKKDPLILKQAGLCALHTHKYHFAEKYFFELANLEGPSPDLFSYYGISLERQQKWQEAEQIYIKQIHHFPSAPNGYRALAWMVGVGLSTMLTIEEGINYAYLGLKFLPDPISWDILSACVARAGNFSEAHHIQEHLLKSDDDSSSRARRSHALRTLRKNLPLTDDHIIRTLVA